MRKQSLWAAGCLSLGLLLGALVASLVRVDPATQIAALPPETSPSGEPAEAPAAPEASEAEPPPDADRAWVEAQAKDLVKRFMAHPWPELDTRQWSSNYVPKATFLIDGTENHEWVTVTAARVPCESVDTVLERAGDPDLGRPDRCDRWLRAALDTMHRHGIDDKSPGEFLAQLEADRSVRVMVVYAGWFKNPQANDEIQLVDARPAFLYPTASFKEQNNAAQNAIYRAMKLGPYAEDSTGELADATLAQRTQ